MTEAVTELIIGGAIILAFIVLAELIWQPYNRRYIAPAPRPSSDPAAQLADIGGTIGGGCVVLAFTAIVAVALLAALLLALEAIP